MHSTNTAKPYLTGLLPSATKRRQACVTSALCLDLHVGVVAPFWPTPSFCLCIGMHVGAQQGFNGERTSNPPPPPYRLIFPRTALSYPRAATGVDSSAATSIGAVVVGAVAQGRP